MRAGNKKRNEAYNKICVQKKKKKMRKGNTLAVISSLRNLHTTRTVSSYMYNREYLCILVYVCISSHTYTHGYTRIHKREREREKRERVHTKHID